MNNVNLIGRLTKDVEIRVSSSGKHVCSFCIAVDSGKENQSYFIDCVAWEARADNIAKYFHKGDKIGIAGLITTRTWENSDGKKIKATEILVTSFDFCNSKSQTEQNNPAPRVENVTTVENTAADNEELSEQLPFEI